MSDGNGDEESKKNGNGRNDWLKQSLINLDGKVSTLISGVGKVEEHCEYCKEELVRHAKGITELRLKNAVDDGEKRGKHDAYSGMDRRTAEKRNRIIVWISIAGFCLSCLVYGISSFKTYEKNVERKMIEVLENKGK
jgi:hypothetical protein